MRQDKIVELGQGLRTAFINQNEQSNLAYKPQFVSNNYKEGRKVISSIYPGKRRYLRIHCKRIRKDMTIK